MRRERGAKGKQCKCVETRRTKGAVEVGPWTMRGLELSLLQIRAEVAVMMMEMVSERIKEDGGGGGCHRESVTVSVHRPGIDARCKSPVGGFH